MNRNLRNIRPLLWPAISVLALACSTALAQESTAAAGGEGEDARARLEAVSVTATRKVEDAKDVPIAVSAVTTEALDMVGVAGDDIRVLAGRLPSLNIESSFGRVFPRFYLRGLGNTDFDLNASQPVSLIYDEIVQENPLLKGFPMFDLAQVEVMRGPQGTLFGRNTPAGVVKFDSAKPNEVFGGYAQINAGRFDTLNIEGAVGGPLGESWRTRFSFLSQHRGDWVDNTFDGPNDRLEGYDDQAIRWQFQYLGQGVFNGLFNVHARRLDGTARLFRANIIAPGTNQFVDDFDPYRISIDARNQQELDSFGASARLRWDFDNLTLHAVTGYETFDAFSRGDIDGGFGASFLPPFGPGFIPFPAETGDGIPDHRQLSQELRLESADWGRLDWQAGVFWFSETLDIDSFSYDTFANGAVNGFAYQRQENDAFAVFGSIDFEVSDNLVARAGVRYTRDEKDFAAQRLTSPFGAPPTDILIANPDDTDLSWDLSATWSYTDAIKFYTRLARGFRAPSIQGRLLFGDTISVAESETVQSFEVGMKADLLDGLARLNLSLFDYTIKDQQLTAVGGSANFNQLINADEGRGRGFEVDFEFYVTYDLLMTLSVSRNDTEIRDPGLGVQPCGGGCTVLDPPGPRPGTVSIDGNPLPQAPEWIYNLSARYSRSIGEGELFVYTDWSYRSEINFYLYESAEFTGDPLLQGGLRVGYRWDHGLNEVAFFGRNILDEIELVGGIDFNNLTGFINEPRVIGVEYTRWF